MKKTLLFVLMLAMLLSLCACGGVNNTTQEAQNNASTEEVSNTGNETEESRSTKEDMLNNAEEVDVATIITDTTNNIAKAKSLYCEKDLLLVGYVCEIAEDYISLNGIDFGVSVVVDIYLPTEDIINLQQNQKVTIVGHMNNEIETRQELFSGMAFDIQHYSMDSAYLVNDKYEVKGVLRGMNSSFGTYNIKIRDKQLDLIYFSDDVDTSNLPFDQEITFLAKVFKDPSSLTYYKDATIVE